MPRLGIRAGLRSITHACDRLRRSEAVRPTCGSVSPRAFRQLRHRSIVVHTLSHVADAGFFFGARGVWSAYSHACWVAPPAIHETPRIPASCFAIIICRRCDSGGPCTARPAAARCYLPRALRTSILLGLPARLYTRATAIVSPVLFALYANRFPHPISSPPPLGPSPISKRPVD